MADDAAATTDAVTTIATPISTSHASDTFAQTSDAAVAYTSTSAAVTSTTTVLATPTSATTATSTSSTTATAAPYCVYIHGGYWQALDVVSSAFFADVVVAAGYNFVALGYDLAPEVS